MHLTEFIQISLLLLFDVMLCILSQTVMCIMSKHTKEL